MHVWDFADPSSGLEPEKKQALLLESDCEGKRQGMPNGAETI